MTAPNPTLRFFSSEFVGFFRSLSTETVSPSSICSLILMRWGHTGPQRLWLCSTGTWVLPLDCILVCLCCGSALVPLPRDVLRPGMLNRLHVCANSEQTLGPAWRGEDSKAGRVWVPLQRTWCLTGSVCHGNTNLTCLEWEYWENRLYASHQLSSAQQGARCSFHPCLEQLFSLARWAEKAV